MGRGKAFGLGPGVMQMQMGLGGDLGAASHTWHIARARTTRKRQSGAVRWPDHGPPYRSSSPLTWMSRPPAGQGLNACFAMIRRRSSNDSFRNCDGLRCCAERQVSQSAHDGSWCPIEECNSQGMALEVGAAAASMASNHVVAVLLATPARFERAIAILYRVACEGGAQGSLVDQGKTRSAVSTAGAGP